MEMESMKSLRITAMAVSALFLGTTLFAQGSLDRKPKPGNPGQGNGPSRPDSKPSNPPSRPDRDQKPRPDVKPSNPPPSRPDPKPSSPPPTRPDRDQKPRPDVKPSNPPPTRPDNDVRPRPDNRPPTRPDTRPDPRPRPDVKPNDPPTRPDNDLRPRPRPDTSPPRVNDPPRTGNGSGNQGPGNPIDRRPTPDRNPRIFDPPPNINNGQLGRIDRPGERAPNPRGQDSNIGRRGGNSYGGQVNNQNREERRGSPIRIDRAPIDIFRGGLEHQVRREDRIRLNGGYRSGYYHYRRDWRDDYFWFNGYIFNPYNSAYCYVSPWYYYPHLPGYVSPRHVTVVNISLTPWYGTAYNWRRPASYTWDNWSNYNSLDYALEDITRAFERVDRRALSRLIPDRDRIAIFVDGEYTYSMEPYDFEQFLLDAVEGTQTIRYEITRVQRKGREAEIQARHEYEDTWGRRTVVYHQYRLEEERNGFVIRRFGTSYYGN